MTLRLWSVVALVLSPTVVFGQGFTNPPVPGIPAGMFPSKRVTPPPAQDSAGLLKRRLPAQHVGDRRQREIAERMTGDEAQHRPCRITADHPQGQSRQRRDQNRGRDHRHHETTEPGQTRHQLARMGPPLHPVSGKRRLGEVDGAERKRGRPAEPRSPQSPLPRSRRASPCPSRPRTACRRRSGAYRARSRAAAPTPPTPGQRAAPSRRSSSPRTRRRARGRA